METKSKEMWKAHEKEVKNMRKRRCFQFRKVVNEFRDKGFEVIEISQYQYRFNEMLDIFPGNKIYQNKKTGVHGKIEGKDFRSFIRQFFGISQ